MAKPSPVAHVDGLLAVHKPINMISKDVSRWLMHRVGRVKLGHVGTLDPAASGVLPLLFGRATRLQDYLLELPKAYEFDVEFGFETTTLDMEGERVREADFSHVTREHVETAVKAFTGEIEQTPPLYSAVKFKGRPLYDYARGGQSEGLPLAEMKRKVHISSFELLSFGDGKASFRVDCSKGTYVRTLVKDVAEKVGTCGTLTRLVRTRAAGIELAATLTLETIEAALASGPEALASLVVPMPAIDFGLPRWQAGHKVVVDRLRGGQQVQVEFAEFHEGAPHGFQLPGWGLPVVLCESGGAAFGIGAVRRHESGRVLVNMKRGL